MSFSKSRGGPEAGHFFSQPVSFEVLSPRGPSQMGQSSPHARPQEKTTQKTARETGQTRTTRATILQDDLRLGLREPTLPGIIAVFLKANLS